MPKRKEPITSQDRAYNVMIDPDVQRKRVDYCKANDNQLNEWEMDFIDDMDTKLSSGQELTGPMAKKLEQIYDKL